MPIDGTDPVIAKLVSHVETIVKESGNPEGFDAAVWLSCWLKEPLPAFGGREPITLLDTASGQALICQALSRLQSGAYA